MKIMVPPVLILTNLTLGILALLSIYNNKIVIVLLLVLVALLFNCLHGYSARKQEITKTILGEKLDSFVGVVIFGAAPATFEYTVSLQQIRFNAKQCKITTFIGMHILLKALFILLSIFILPLAALAIIMMVAGKLMISNLPLSNLKKIKPEVMGYC